MSTNYSLDFSGKTSPQVQDRIRDGMKRADENANYFWKKILDGCVLAAARRLPELTVDDVLDELDAINVSRKKSGKSPIETHAMDALGPAMSRARKDKIISPTDRVKRSQRPEKHGNRHNVWLSNFYTGARL
jgi:hypothetical protein